MQAMRRKLYLSKRVSG